MIKRIKKLIRQKNFIAVVLFAVLVFNFSIFTKIAAANFVQTSGAANFWTITPKTQSSTNSSRNGGLIGSMLDTGNIVLSGCPYSVDVGDPGADCVPGGSASTSSSSPTTLEYDLQQKFDSRPSVLNFIASANNSILAQKPLSGVDFVQQKVFALTNPGAVYAQSAQAQQYYSPGGTGYDLLKPVQNFWSWSVRVVYGFLIIIVIILAFAIMFRQKLSGGVEVTIQNAIPSIALVVILPI